MYLTKFSRLMFYTFKQWDMCNCKVTKEMSCLHKAIVMNFLKKKSVCVCLYTLQALPTDHHRVVFGEDLFLALVSDLKIRFKGWEV